MLGAQVGGKNADHSETFRIDAIGPTADPSMDDGASSLSVRNGVLDGFAIDEHFGMGFSATRHELASWHPEVERGPSERLVYTQRIRSARQIERWSSENLLKPLGESTDAVMTNIPRDRHFANGKLI